MTVYKLKDEIDEAANRLMFLLDYAKFPCMNNFVIYLQNVVIYFTCLVNLILQVNLKIARSTL